MSKRILILLAILLTAASLNAQTDQPATLLITEVFYDTPGADELREWVEIANVGTAVLDLSDIKIGDEETPGGDEGMKRFPDGAQIEAGQVIVVAQTAAGFWELYGRLPDYEISNTNDDVPDMRGFPLWAGGDFALGNAGDELLLVAGMTIIDALSYGERTTIFNPAVPGVASGQSIARTPANCDSDSSADWQAQSTPTPGQISLDEACAVPAEPPELEDLMPIGQIQGSGPVSPFVDEVVTFRGVVIGQYEDINTSGVTYYTLFVQDLPGQEDGDPDTADGMAIFLGRQRPSTPIGSQIRVTGTVTEFYDYTEIDDAGLEIVLEAAEAPLPAPIVITPPRGRPAQLAYFEPLESMRVAMTDPANVVGPTYSGCGFTVVDAVTDLERAFRRSADDLAPPLITILHTSDVTCGDFPHVKVVDSVNGISGPLIYNFDEFKIVQMATDDLVVTAVPFPPLPTPPIPTANQFSIATFNVENHFDSIDDTGDEAEPKPSADEIAAKQAKLVEAISHTLGCPTLLAIQEVENEALLLDLAEAAAADCGFTYQVSHRDSADVRGIDLALLSDPRRVTVTAVSLQQTCSLLDTGIKDPSIDCPGGQQPLFSRPPLQVDLAVDGQAYTVVVNHFKSKRGDEITTAPRRLFQAQHIADLLAQWQAADPNVRVIILGDFNDYELSPALELMTTHGLTNVLQQVPDADRYSFNYGGISQLIDGMLVTENLLDAVTAVTIQHTNADFPDNLGRDLSPANLAYKTTDHDLPLLVLNLYQEPEPATPTPVPDTAVTPTPTGDNQESGSASSWWLWLLGGLVAAGTAVFAFFFRRK
jgi:predicted extracellular nuclease